MDKKLNISSTDFKGLFIIEPNSFIDERGFFSRIFCEEELQQIGNIHIKQINHSYTKDKGSVRGLHFQYEPNSEAKIIKCLKGAIYDIAVDIRKNSPTFLKYFSIELTQKNQKMLYIPKGFAHGFQTLEKDTEILYLHTNIYTPNNEAGLNIKDPKINIKLPLDIVSLSKRDKEHTFLDDHFQGIVLDEM